VLEDRTGSDANPALLCYVRKGRSLVETLHREVLERSLLGEEVIVPADNAGDVAMT
jgi:ubiquitin carboxyl-terminal hydrolase 25/28